MSPKITVHGGVTNAFEQGPPGFTAAWSDEDTPNEWPAQQADAEATEGGEQPSPGNISSPSAETPPTSDEPTKPNARSRARTTANRSKKRGAASTAGSADDTATN